MPFEIEEGKIQIENDASETVVCQSEHSEDSGRQSDICNPERRENRHG